MTSFIESIVKAGLEAGWSAFEWRNSGWKVVDMVPFGDESIQIIFEKDDEFKSRNFCVEQIIFDIEWNKKVWGEEYISVRHGNWDEVANMTTESVIAWQYHLSQFAPLSPEEREKYILDNLKGRK